MIEILFSIALVALSVGLIVMLRTIKHLLKEIDEIKEVLQHHRIKLKILDFYDLSEHEKRLDQLEEVLKLKEYFDEEPLNEE